NGSARLQLHHAGKDLAAGCGFAVNQDNQVAGECIFGIALDRLGRLLAALYKFSKTDFVIEDVFEVGVKRVDPSTPAPPQIDDQFCVGASFRKQGVDIVAGLEKCGN